MALPKGSAARAPIRNALSGILEDLYRVDILLLGPPGAGKGTQGAILSDRIGVPKFATGDLLREAVRGQSPLGLQAKAVMEAGGLVSDDIILGVVAEELDKPASADGVIFDGVVRTIPQAEGLSKILAAKGRQVDLVLFFEVSDEEILARLEKRRLVESRADDDPLAVQRRLTAYRLQTAPVLDWYQHRVAVHRVPATGTVAEIAASVQQIVGR